jgi:hypothetical protein
MANGILLLDLEDPLAEYGQMDVNQNIPQDAQLPPSAPVRAVSRRVWWAAGLATLAVIAALAFGAYSQPELLLNFVGLRYCG